MQKIDRTKDADPAEIIIGCRCCGTVFRGSREVGVRGCPGCGILATVWIPGPHGGFGVFGPYGSDFRGGINVERGHYEKYVGPKSWRRGVGKKYSIPGIAPDDARAQGENMQAFIAGQRGMPYGRPVSSLREAAQRMARKPREEEPKRIIIANPWTPLPKERK